MQGAARVNLDQIIRRADFIADSVRASGTVSSLWIPEEKVDLANEVYELVQPTLRLARRGYYARRMLSTDSSTTILRQTYAPSSLALVADTRTYTLPPDFIEVLRLSPRISTTDLTNQGTRFVKRDLASPEYVDRDLSGSQSGTQQTGHYLFDLQGERTLRISPAARAAMEVELVYVAQRPPLYRTVTGTVSVSSLTVTGVSTVFSDAALQLGDMEVILGTSGSATVPTPSLQTSYPRVASLDSSTQLTLVGPTPGTYAAGTGFILSSVPQIPVVHHRWLAAMMAVMMHRKINFAVAEAMLKTKFAEWVQFVQPNLVAPVQSQDAEETEAFGPDR